MKNNEIPIEELPTGFKEAFEKASENWEDYVRDIIKNKRPEHPKEKQNDSNNKPKQEK